MDHEAGWNDLPFVLFFPSKQDSMKLRLVQIECVTEVDLEFRPSHLCLKSAEITGLCNYTQLFHFLPYLLSPPPLQLSSLFLLFSPSSVGN